MRNKIKKILKNFILYLTIFLNFSFLTLIKIEAAKKTKIIQNSTSSLNTTNIIQSGQVIQFGTIDNLLWSIIATIQAYTLPVMAIAIALLGIKLVMSNDDTSAKDSVKAWITKILVGGVLVFGASTLATIIKSAVGG